LTGVSSCDLAIYGVVNGSLSGLSVRQWGMAVAKVGDGDLGVLREMLREQLVVMEEAHNRVVQVGEQEKAAEMAGQFQREVEEECERGELRFHRLHPY